jgi:RimJ/RimL family protein N-acetyltransferase/8-oxo-dGTP pyrophosphatase MutT (NUDIX family)
LEIATEHPTGSTVAVRRPGPHGIEVLVLHRNANGPDYEGDWAWTGPAGCRQPGEAVYPAALRELAEEAGLDDLRPWAVDLSDRWALFAVDVDADVDVDLRDPEHDRYEWLAVDQMARRVLPRSVAEQQARAAAVPRVDLSFRPMAESDFAAVAGWHSSPHVLQWWDRASLDEPSVRARYLPRLQGDEPTRMWVMEADGHPAAMLQSYHVGAYDDYAESTGDPDAIGFDYLIGEPGLIGRGIGTRMIWEFCRDVLRREYPQAPRFLASPSRRNERSIRVLAKCGFTRGNEIPGVDEPGLPAEPEVVCTLDVAHWFGLETSANVSAAGRSVSR